MTSPAPTIGIVSPGAMGSALGAVWQRGGARVIATVSGRSRRTQELAQGLTLLGSLPDVVSASDFVISVGPPENALRIAADIAGAAAGTDNRPLVVDVNAVSPTTMATVTGILREVGLGVVDGAISGMPPAVGGATTLYLAGPLAASVAEISAGPELRRVVVGQRIGSASAVKMCTASMYKGFSGLLMQALLTARANDVVPFVLDDLAGKFGDQTAKTATQIALAASKSDRYPGEMRQIAETQSAAGARGELFAAFAMVFEQAAASELGTLSPEEARTRGDLTAVLNGLASPVRATQISPTK